MGEVAIRVQVGVVGWDETGEEGEWMNRAIGEVEEEEAIGATRRDLTSS